MATVINPIILKITNAGKLNALSLNSSKVELSVKLTHIAIGSARYTATGNEIGIKTLISKIDTIAGDIDVANNTLHFSATIYANQPTPVYELGLLDSTGGLFAIAASLNTPLFTLYPNVAFVVAFGISLNEASSGSVTVTISPNNSLMPAIMQNHLAAPNPHPQYLNVDHLDVSKDPHPQYVTLSRFQLLLDTMLPVGYLHHTHDTVNPKPQFDALLGISTAWRRLAGKIIVGTDPADPYIKDVGLTLGQKGMTEDAGVNRPHVYPLYTTNIFERYNPDDFIETVWLVSADKTAVNEGEGVRFTVSANNLPDGQILQWTAKEGALNTASNDITAPVKTASGTVILKNGTAIIDFVTAPDNNQIDPQMHVRLTVGLPANLSINVPIVDSGRTEKFIHITQSTINGIVLDEYYKQHSGAYPVSTDKVRFIINEGVDVVAANTTVPAILDGEKWPAGSQVTVENKGRILGRGGNGGRAAEWLGAAGVTSNNWNEGNRLMLPQNGANGGTAIKGKMIVENYGMIAGGGGGGGGGGMVIFNTPIAANPNGVFETIGGAGAGGGAPFGKRAPNGNTIESLYQYYAEDNYTLFDYTKEAQPMYMTQTNASSGVTNFLSWYSPAHQWIGKTIPFKDQSFKLTSPVFFLPHYHSDGLHYNIISYVEASAAIDKTRPSIVHEGYTLYQHYSVTLKQSSDGGKTLGGTHGYGGMAADGTNLDAELLMPNYFESLDLSLHHGGAGGDLGAIGSNGVNTLKTTLNKLKGRFNTTYQIAHTVPPATGGLAGFVKEGAVVINNFAGGSTKGR